MDSMYKGTLKRWNDDKGFGFIRPENAKRDIFIHISALKNMSRRPISGDIIFYQIHTDNGGKNRAVNAKIEGVATTKLQVRRKTVTGHTHSSNPFHKLLFFGLLIFAGLFFYKFYFKNNNSLVVRSSPVISAPKLPIISVPKQVKYDFKCDERQYCSQMNSRDEAVFFISNCPNTKMDGDNDGIPCENDTRFKF